MNGNPGRATIWPSAPLRIESDERTLIIDSAGADNPLSDGVSQARRPEGVV